MLFKMPLDVSKFSIPEIFNNSNGRSSATKAVGLLTSFVCLTLFIILVIFYFIHTGEASTVITLIDKTIAFFGIGTGLMGVKSISSAISSRLSDTSNQQGSQQQQEQSDSENL